MAERSLKHALLGVGEDLGPAPATYKRKSTVVRFPSGHIHRLPDVDLEEWWTARAAIEDAQFVAHGATEELAEEELVAIIEEYLGVSDA